MNVCDTSIMLRVHCVCFVIYVRKQRWMDRYGYSWKPCCAWWIYAWKSCTDYIQPAVDIQLLVSIAVRIWWFIVPKQLALPSQVCELIKTNNPKLHLTAMIITCDFGDMLCMDWNTVTEHMVLCAIQWGLGQHIRSVDRSTVLRIDWNRYAVRLLTRYFFFFKSNLIDTQFVFFVCVNSST